VIIRELDVLSSTAIFKSFHRETNDLSKARPKNSATSTEAENLMKAVPLVQSALISDEKAAEFRHKVYRAITFTHVQIGYCADRPQ